MVKKEELTRISGPIFERVDRAYRRLEEVHGRQGGGFVFRAKGQYECCIFQGMGGALQLVDLAGADFDDRDVTNSSTNSTTATTAQQRKESIDINKSLLALKECFRFKI